MSETARVIAPPPLIFLGGTAVGLLADQLAGLPAMPGDRWVTIGLAAIAGIAGSALIAAALGRFRRAGTPPEPWKPTAALSVDGIYRRTRNPMYLGMALLMLALGLAFASSGVLLALVPTLLIVDRFVIQREERYLDRLFGESFRTYRAEVRRWI